MYRYSRQGVWWKLALEAMSFSEEFLCWVQQAPQKSWWLPCGTIQSHLYAHRWAHGQCRAAKDWPFSYWQWLHQDTISSNKKWQQRWDYKYNLAPFLRWPNDAWAWYQSCIWHPHDTYKVDSRKRSVSTTYGILVKKLKEEREAVDEADAAATGWWMKVSHCILQI